MSMSSFYTALSGLEAQGTAINVVGDNLANVNTVGFKGSDVSFGDLVTRGMVSASGNPMQPGLGVTVTSISPHFVQGTLHRTDRALDVALEGDGFIMNQAADGSLHYTRAGNMFLSATGDLLSDIGESVLGWQTRATDGTIPATGTPAPINIPQDLTMAPQATTDLSTGLNLDAQAATGAVFATSMTVFDSLGATHVLDFTYTKTGANTWGYAVTIDGADLAGGTPGPVTLNSGTLAFDASGALDPATGVNGGAPADITLTTPAGFANGGAALSTNWDLVRADGTSPLTGVAGPSTVSSATQDGHAAGTLADFSIDAAGVIVGRFTNGETLDIARIAVADFANLEGLLRVSDNRFAETRASGAAVIGAAGTGGRGRLIGGTLELSNVDIAEEFTSLIVAQRGYQASSRVITTSDEITQETINLKR